MSTVSKDPRKYLYTYFGVRNGIRGNPVEGKNFTKETLTYMTSKNRADQITSMIIEKMYSYGQDVPFGVFECCAGIGGNTMSFLDNRLIKWVVSYEILPERSAMLENNIKMYNLAKGGRSFIMEKAFEGVPEKYKNSVLYFDPPWLPAGIKGHESTKDQYILDDIKIGDKTLEEWIALCSHCAMIVARVPPGYRTKPVQGFKIEQINLKNSDVVFAIPNRVIENMSRKPASTLPKPPASLTSGLPALPTSISTSALPALPTSTLTTGLEKLPPGVDENDRQWYENLRAFLRDDILKRIISSEEHRNKMVSFEAMKIWVVCFTHESYNPNKGMNYEELELLGDHSMEHAFVKYLYNTIPNMNRALLSNIKMRYISKEHQSKVGLEMRLGEHLRTKADVNIHINEDLLESLFGGLEQIGDKVFKFGAGFGLAYNMILHMFKDIKIDPTIKKKDKTVVKELFNKMGWKEQIESYEYVDGTHIASISFSPEAVAYFKSSNINVNPLIVKDTGTTKKVAFNNAYEKALAILRKMGLTDDYVKRYRKYKEFSRPEFQPYIANVREKVTNNGYEDFNFVRVQQTDHDVYIQLVGVKSDGTIDILSEHKGANDIETKINVLKNYLNK